MTTQSELAALDAAATQGEWEIAAYYTATGPDEMCHGLVEADGFPIGIIDEEQATVESLSPNLEFIATLVNLYRANKLVLVPSVEEVAIHAATALYGPGFDPHHNPEAFDFCEKFARAVLTSMGAKTDG